MGSSGTGIMHLMTGGGIMLYNLWCSHCVVGSACWLLVVRFSRIVHSLNGVALNGVVVRHRGRRNRNV